jgi:hypothetical protein
MLRIFTHIERLLLTNDCVIIPEFGGFVLHPCPAVYQPEKHRFCPPGKGIVFNPTLKHYDRLIPESYIQMYGMTFEEAHISLRKDIGELHHILDKEGAVYFEKIGFLRKDDVGKMFFEVERNSSFVGLKPYGLYPFHLPPVAVNVIPQIKIETTQTIKNETQPKRMVYFPVNKPLLRVIGVSAAAVALFLLVSTPINDVGRSSYSASLIPSEIILKGEIEEIEEIGEIGEAEIYESKSQPTSSATDEMTPTQKIIEATSQTTYYAIIGSFTSEKQANQFMQQVNMPELTTMGIVTNDGRVRVYAEKFDKREDAQNYILRLRANVRLKDTWLFVEQ